MWRPSHWSFGGRGANRDSRELLAWISYHALSKVFQRSDSALWHKNHVAHQEKQHFVRFHVRQSSHLSSHVTMHFGNTINSINIAKSYSHVALRFQLRQQAGHDLVSRHRVSQKIVKLKFTDNNLPFRTPVFLSSHHFGSSLKGIHFQQQYAITIQTSCWYQTFYTFVTLWFDSLRIVWRLETMRCYWYQRFYLFILWFASHHGGDVWRLETTALFHW